MSTNLPINIPESPYCRLDGHESYEILYEVSDEYYGIKFSGETIEEALTRLAQAQSSISMYDGPTSFESLEIKAIIYIPANYDAIAARVRELNAERKAKEAAAQLQQSLEFYNILLDAWQKRVDALNAEAGDYTPEGFNKRWKALQDQKPVKPLKP